MCRGIEPPEGMHHVAVAGGCIATVLVVPVLYTHTRHKAQAEGTAPGPVSKPGVNCAEVASLGGVDLSILHRWCAHSPTQPLKRHLFSLSSNSVEGVVGASRRCQREQRPFLGDCPIDE